jgi:alkanesulfonate monooxygenase SsuD/methylene tetrahydromethanopterin reductase-like flavin-dependent oxidoreductase (luciferase family)
VYSYAGQTVVGKDEAEVARRAEASGTTAEEARAEGRLIGTPDEVVERIGQFAALGATRFYLQILDLDDLDHLELIASEVARQLD